MLLSLFYFFCFLTAIYLTAIIEEQLHSTNVNHRDFWPEGHLEPCSEIGSLSPAECQVVFEPGTLQFWLEHLNPLGHSLIPLYLIIYLN